MEYVDTALHRTHLGAGGPDAPVIYVIDQPDNPFDLDGIATRCRASIVSVPVREWDQSLTPWPAPNVRPQVPDFGGHADATLQELVGEAIPAIELAEGLAPAARGICGYSLGGLFALYAFVNAGSFRGCASLSGSVWYPGWVSYLREHDFDGAGRYAYLSVGSRERHARQPLMRTVQDSMLTCADILCADGCEVDTQVGPGNHFQHVRERFDAGVSALDRWLSREA